MKLQIILDPRPVALVVKHGLAGEMTLSGRGMDACLGFNRRYAHQGAHANNPSLFQHGLDVGENADMVQAQLGRAVEQPEAIRSVGAHQADVGKVA